MTEAYDYEGKVIIRNDGKHCSNKCGGLFIRIKEYFSKYGIKWYEDSYIPHCAYFKGVRLSYIADGFCNGYDKYTKTVRYRRCEECKKKYGGGSNEKR